MGDVDIVANDCASIDDDAHAVADIEAITNLCSNRNVDEGVPADESIHPAT